MVGLQTLDDELRNCPTVRKEDVQALLEWAKMQPHLPNFDEIPGDIMAVLCAMFLERRYNSLERAKETFDNFFAFRNLAPELTAHRSLKTTEVQTYLAMNYTMVMDKRDSEGNVICFQYLHDPDLKSYDFNSSVRTIMMIIESWFYENGSAGSPGVTLVLDQREFSLSHLARMPLASMKKLNTLNKDCFPISVKNVYVIHATNIIQTILTTIRPLLNGELFKKIRTFTPSQMDEFYKVVPKEAVPYEYGGTAGSLQDLDMISVKRLERCEEIFQKFDRLKVDESRRRGPEKNANSMFGLEGSFKKLNVD